MGKYYFCLKTVSLRSVLSLLVLILLTSGCGEPLNEIKDSFDIDFDAPSLIEVSVGGEYTFAGANTSSLIDTDDIILESENGISYICPILSIAADSFTISLSNEIKTGYYVLYIKRDNRKKLISKTYINIVEDLDFTPDAGTTVYGMVSADGSPVQGVVVSDGIEVSVTDERGIYQLESEKKWGYVFISIPSGYEVPANGVLPQFYKIMRGDATTLERVDFSLTAVEGQDDYSSMREVLTRRLSHYVEEQGSGEGFGRLPDLILLDGGKGHVSAILPVIAQFGLDIPVFGMVKDSRHRTRAIAKDGGEIAISGNRAAFSFVTTVQDEVHRYSINYQKTVHKQSALEITITRVPGIGKKKAEALLKAYKTRAELLAASPEALQKTAKVKIETANELYDFLHALE